jgi:hypothetical protein
LADRRPKDLSDENGRSVMKGRRLVVVLGLILATLATVGVLAMPAGFDDDVDHGRPMVGVVVSKVDIPAGTDMDRLIKDDQFRVHPGTAGRRGRRRGHLGRPVE